MRTVQIPGTFFSARCNHKRSIEPCYPVYVEYLRFLLSSVGLTIYEDRQNDKNCTNTHTVRYAKIFSYNLLFTFIFDKEWVRRKGIFLL